MKPIFCILTLAFFTIAGTLNAQRHRDKVEALRTTFISKRINLSEQQSEKFWPLYNEYHNKVRMLRRDLKKLYVLAESADDQESLRLYETELKLRQTEADIHKNYLAKILDLLGGKKFVQLRLAEDDFKKQMIESIRDRNE